VGKAGLQAVTDYGLGTGSFLSAPSSSRDVSRQSKGSEGFRRQGWLSAPVCQRP
jgi:hypothetical protein